MQKEDVNSLLAVFLMADEVVILAGGVNCRASLRVFVICSISLIKVEE